MAKTPGSLIGESSKVIRSVMFDQLTKIYTKLVNDIMNANKNLTDSFKSEAVKKVNSPSWNAYKVVLREALSVVSKEAINMATNEVPANVKFGEYENLSPSIQRYIDARAMLYAQAQVEELDNKLRLTYLDSIENTDSTSQVRDDLSMAGKVFVSGSVINAGSVKIVGDIVNHSRKEYFSQPEVDQKIEAYKFTNPSPVTKICKELNGHIFAKDDPNVDAYLPPLHWNCQSYMVPILVGNMRGRKPSKFEPTKAASQQIKFHEQCSCHLEVKLQESNMPEVKTPREGNLQSIIVSKDVAKSVGEAKRVAKDFGAKNLNVDETNTSYRFRQRNPSDFVRTSFRSKSIDKAGVTLIYGQLA